MKALRTSIMGLLLLAMSLAGSPLFAKAQTNTDPSLWITWRAATYIPGEYQGRALAVAGSSVVVALDVIQNGLPMDLSKEVVYWYVNDHYLTGGPGVTRTSFKMPSIVGQDSITVRASLPQTLGGIAKTITLPVVAPEAVIEVAPPDATTLNSAFDVYAKPYFFNVNDASQLNISWAVNQQSPSTYNDPVHLKINIPKGTPSGTTFAVDLKIENAARAFETALYNLILTVQ